MNRLGLILWIAPLLFWQCSQTPYKTLRLSPAQQAALKGALEEKGQQYDASEKMLISKFSSPGYHTTLTSGKVHRTRESLTYAASCLDSDDPTLKQRGFEIIDRVIDLQDQNPNSKTYGLWPWFLEEPLEQMSPPDWNWADFCAVQLLQAVIYHKDEFDAALLEKVNQSIYHAARSIQIRNVGPDYTNIALMGTYVTMMTAELQNLADLKAYATDRLQRFYDYTMKNGSFTEYNSPTYTVVALKELARMRQHFRDRAARKLVQALYDLAWEEIAVHFHPPSWQWGGPHSRCYHTFLPDKTLSFIQSATSNAVSFNIDPVPDLEWHRMNIRCPKELEHYFIDLEEPRLIKRQFLGGDFPLIGTTYNTPSYSLGSINRGDFWNQRRPLIAYWGTAENPSYLRARFLHDGYDFAAAQFYSVQKNGAVLFGITFATDGGDTHVNLDRLKEGRFTASDLRLRFEFGGRAAENRVNPPRTLQDNALLAFPDLDVRISIPWAVFGDFRPYWEGEMKKKLACYDVVLYNGKKKNFDLNEIKAGIAGLVATGSRTEMKGALHGQLEGDKYTFSYADLELSFPVIPAKASELYKRVIYKK